MKGHMGRMVGVQVFADGQAAAIYAVTSHFDIHELLRDPMGLIMRHAKRLSSSP